MATAFQRSLSYLPVLHDIMPWLKIESKVCDDLESGAKTVFMNNLFDRFIDLMKITNGHSTADTPMALGGLLIMLLFSIPFIAIGFYSIRKRNRILTKGFHTTALITGAERHYDRQITDEKIHHSYTPVIKFRDDRGKDVTRPIPYSFNVFGGRPRSLSDGNEIEIAYLPSNRGEIEPVGALFTITNGIFFFVGLFMDSLGIYLFLFG